MDAITVVCAMYEVFKFMHDCINSATKNDRTAGDILSRLLVFEPHLETIRSNVEAGRFQDQSKMQALLRLCDAVQGADKWVRKHLRAKNGGLVVWAKGRWHAKGNMEELEDIATRIDRAVQDLTFAEITDHNHLRATAQAGIEGFQEQLRGELGCLGRKVDALLQRAFGANAAASTAQLEETIKQEIAELCQINVAEVSETPANVVWFEVLPVLNRSGY
ncbi:hypothetical protein T484DRAFT_1839001 [Baffinella frigidus]|nr:hypothetical protein T484DRAFT_1839001 [Cryptophyta sp. CCMP2293]